MTFLESVSEAIGQILAAPLQGGPPVTHADIARAALAAMREPTSEMLEAARWHARRCEAAETSLSFVEIWRTMVDVAVLGQRDDTFNQAWPVGSAQIPQRSL